jgi:hypothetical protein
MSKPKVQILRSIGHAELGSASHGINVVETLKQVQGDKGDLFQRSIILWLSVICHLFGRNVARPAKAG